MDTALFHLINGTLANPVFDAVMPWYTNAWPLVAGLAFLPLLIRDPARAVGVFCLALLALGLADALGQALKHWIARPRPCAVLPEARVLVGCGASWAMPSNHAATAFGALSVVALLERRRSVCAAFVTLAFLVALSRVVVGVHWVSDVVAGALLGFGTAVMVSRLFPWIENRRRRHPEAVTLALALAAITIVRIIFIVRGPYDLSGDEAHYWEWSRHLDWSYYSKGPLIAWCIRLFTTVLGPSEIGVRFGALVFSVLTSVVLYRFTRDLGGRPRAALVAAVLPHGVPIFAVYGIVFTIDPPFIFFWTLSLWLFHRALSDGGTGRWLALGAAVGLGLLAKYTMGLFLGAALLYLLAVREDRHWIARPGPWAGLALSLCFFLPVLLWNASHDWVSFRHTAGHVVQAGGMRLSLRSFGDFLGSQLAVVSPGVLILFVVLVLRGRTGLPGRAYGLLLCFSVPIFLFFAAKSLQGKVQGNWAMEAYPALFVLTALRLDERKLTTRMRSGVSAAFALALLMTALLHAPGVVHRFADRFAIMDKLMGWRELAAETDRQLGTMPRPERTFVVSDYYMVSSELAFYMRGRPFVHNVNLGRRMNQYQLWPGFHNRTGDDALFVIMSDAPMPERFATRFDRVERQRLAIRRYGKTLQTFTLFRCFGFRGMTPREVHTF